MADSMQNYQQAGFGSVTAYITPSASEHGPVAIQASNGVTGFYYNGTWYNWDVYSPAPVQEMRLPPPPALHVLDALGNYVYQPYAAQVLPPGAAMVAPPSYQPLPADCNCPYSGRDDFATYAAKPPTPSPPPQLPYRRHIVEPTRTNSKSNADGRSYEIIEIDISEAVELYVAKSGCNLVVTVCKQRNAESNQPVGQHTPVVLINQRLVDDVPQQQSPPRWELPNRPPFGMQPFERPAAAKTPPPPAAAAEPPAAEAPQLEPEPYEPPPVAALNAFEPQPIDATIAFELQPIAASTPTPETAPQLLPAEATTIPQAALGAITKISVAVELPKHEWEQQPKRQADWQWAEPQADWAEPRAQWVEYKPQAEWELPKLKPDSESEQSKPSSLLSHFRAPRRVAQLNQQKVYFNDTSAKSAPATPLKPKAQVAPTPATDTSGNKELLPAAVKSDRILSREFHASPRIVRQEFVTISNQSLPAPMTAIIKPQCTQLGKIISYEFTASSASKQSTESKQESTLTKLILQERVKRQRPKPKPKPKTVKQQASPRLQTSPRCQTSPRLPASPRFQPSPRSPPIETAAKEEDKSEPAAAKNKEKPAEPAPSPTPKPEPVPEQSQALEQLPALEQPKPEDVPEVVVVVVPKAAKQRSKESKASKSKSKLAQEQPKALAAKPKPKAKKNKIDNLLLSTPVQEPEIIQPFGNNNSLPNQSKQRPAKLSKLERKAMRRVARELQPPKPKPAPVKPKSVPVAEVAPRVEPRKEASKECSSEVTSDSDLDLPELKHVYNQELRRKLIAIIQKIKKL
ncbi:titin isoform X2 [Drosophila busckii]|uniref:titin isoform X2 n=1 Tax=Drosophila busckii TaxID=30019 RepID=UPI00083F19D1|nr:titin isoform X2 [Drosophila busckii]